MPGEKVSKLANKRKCVDGCDSDSPITKKQIVVVTKSIMAVIKNPILQLMASRVGHLSE